MILFLVLLIVALFATFVALGSSVAMCVLLAYTPIFQLLPEGSLIREVAIILRYACFLAVIVRYLRTGQPLKRLLWGNTISKLVIIWGAELALSLAISGRYNDWSLRALLRIGSYIATYFVFYSWFDDSRKLRLSWNVITGFMLAIGIFAVAQIIANDYTPVYWIFYDIKSLDVPWEGRATSFLDGPNSLGSFCNFFAPVTLALAFLRPLGAWRFLYAAAFLASAASIVLSGSRGAVIALGATCFLATFYFSKRCLIRVISVSVFAAAIPIILVAASLFSNRLTAVDQQESVISRYAIWGQAISLFGTHPILGIGIGNFRSSYNTAVLSEDAGKIDTHNLYLQFLTETGVLGFVIFLCLALYVVYKSASYMRQYTFGSYGYVCSFIAGTAMLSVLIHGFVDFFFVGASQFGAAFGIILAYSSVTLDSRVAEAVKIEARKKNLLSRVILHDQVLLRFSTRCGPNLR